ncbi:MAG: type II toxin-antitoxin system Phd/YefM family antitoxin [Proteobacteria bacterium]|jgi:prevent-host-death family protein|nr:type II toxin-antitoxin system Phd/YefM family antitoxin [Pseudomonadota bacterium]
MKNAITATQAKQEFGELILRSQKSPVRVTKNGKPVAVIMSEADYQRILKQNLRAALIEGELSGDAGELDMQTIKEKARKQMMADAQNT